MKPRIPTSRIAMPTLNSGLTASELSHKASLDSRFRDRPDDIFLVKGLLEILEGFLKECAATSKNEKGAEEALGKIDSIVHDLIVIGVAIRGSGRKSRLQKADAAMD
jgi:hypothetical protein